jgi:hypothetical protein
VIRILVSSLVLAALPLVANAATMEGVIDELSSGNVFGTLVLSRNSGEDHYSFNFRTAELHVEGIHWSNLNSYHKTANSSYLAELSCPRKKPCRIQIGKTHVRITYDLRDGKRFATNIVPLDPG